MNFIVKNKEEFEIFVSTHWMEMNQYIDEKMKKVDIPLYCSVDIREDRNKICAIDNNLYPAGFNNLCCKDRENAARLFQTTLQAIVPGSKTIGILPEGHTRNLLYLEGLFTLSECITKAGYQVYLLSPDEDFFKETASSFLQLESANGHQLVIYKAEVRDGIFILPALPEMRFDIIVLNHDQSTPLNVDWSKIRTPVAPHPDLGWYARQKNRHFTLYSEVIQSFAEHFGIDPTLLRAKFKTVANVDFDAPEDLKRLGKVVDELKAELNQESKIFVKASKGTYGMGISVVSSGDEIVKMNRKTRNKMAVGKNSIKFTDLLVQEGIETILKYDNMPAEITIYLIGGHSVGGFMRANSVKGPLDNLNSRGMVFHKFCVCDIRETTNDVTDDKIKEAMYTIVARLSALAAGLEMKEI